MQTLRQTLQDHDIGFLHILGELWGIEVPSRNHQEAVSTIHSTMLQQEELSEIVEALPESSLRALIRLLQEKGRLPAGDFAQQFGDIRSMGPGRRDRDRPWRSPISDAERLYYRGLIAKAFGDSPVGPKEFVFLPSDLQPLLSEILASSPSEPVIQPPSGQPAHIQPASSAIVDDAATLLAGLRQKPAGSGKLSARRSQHFKQFLVHPEGLSWILHLLTELEILQIQPLQPNTETLPRLLDPPRNQALRTLAHAWLKSKSWNDFNLLSHLEPASGGWPQEPRSLREGALKRVEVLPQGEWLDLPGFLQEVRRQYPTFARPGGDFDSWYLRDRRTGHFLQGLEAWDAVDGALLRALIIGPLHWLGAVDLGFSAEADHPDQFRLSPWSQVFFDPKALPALPEPEAHASLRPNGQLIIPRAVHRKLRYQVARLCTWEAFEDDQYHYRLRPSALLAASEQGLRSQHVQLLLQEVSEDPIPPHLIAGIDRLMNSGLEARLDTQTLLRVKDSSLLDKLLAHKGTSRWISERLGPTAALVPTDDLQSLIEESVRHGLLIEPTDES